jgi:two-component system nitrogen regulation response regulator NtrX
VERLVIMCPADQIDASDLPGDLFHAPQEIITGSLRLNTLQEFKDEAEKTFILAKLRENGWNVSKTAEAIDTPRSNLYKKIEQYGIKRDGTQSEIPE